MSSDLERRENFGALAFRQNGTAFAFQSTHAGVAIETDDQRITQSASLFEAADMPRMQQIEATIGEDDTAAVAFLAAKPHNRFLKSQNTRVQRNSMKAQAKTGLLSDEKLVYHARQPQCLQAWPS